MSGQELNRRAMESLIRAGAFDSLGVNRHAMLTMLDAVLESVADDGRKNIAGQFDLFGEGGGSISAQVAVPDVEEFSRAELMSMERETTGLYHTGHPMDEYRDAARRAGAVNIGAILSDFAEESGPERFSDEQMVTVAGIISGKRTRTTRNGTLMAYIQLEDDTGSIELLAFQRVLDTCGGYIAENVAVVVRGRISVRDEKEPQIVVDSLRPISDAVDNAMMRPGQKGPAKLWVRLPGQSARVMRRIELLLEMFPGEDKLYFTSPTADAASAPGRLVHPALVEGSSRAWRGRKM